MIRHVVVMRFEAGTTSTQREAIADGVRALAQQVPTVHQISCGNDAGLADGNADFVVVADFEDEAGYLTYAAHPAHVALLDQRIRPVLRDRTAVQYRLGHS